MRERLVIERPLAMRPEPPVSNARLAIILFVASEAMLFASLIAGYVVLRGGSDGFVGMEPLPVGLAWLSMSVLLASSVVLVAAQRALNRGNRRLFNRGSLAAFLLGLLFLALQIVEWGRLVAGGLVPESNVHSGIFYALSGIHGVHVVGGLLLLAILAIRALRGAFGPGKRNFVVVAAIYWHFVTLVWAALFLMLFVL
jgi:heme/copper-type cytochrome/quinol oxidase subunit 3